MNFKTVKLSDIIEIIGGGTPKTSRVDYWNGDIPWLSVKDFNNDNRYVYSTEKSITQAGLENSSTKLLRKDDIIISARGTVGEISMIPFPMAFNQSCYGIRGKNCVDKSYLYYLLKYNIYKLKKLTHGSVFDTITRSTFEQIEINLPALETQKKIGYMLGLLDDKIELNNKINKNLEEQAKIIFRNYTTKNISSQLVSVADVFLTANTGADAIKKAPIVEHNTGIRCIRVGDLSNKRSFFNWGYTEVTDNVFNQYQLHKNDIVITRTASIGLNTIISDDLQAVYNNGLIRLTVNENIILPLFLYRQFQTDNFSKYIACIEHETSVRPNMKINYLLKYKFSLPSIKEQKSLINLLEPMINKQNALIIENERLSALRDALLPELLSGRLNI
ncbi:MAG: restriction endonuclease subunit S [Ruminococcus sp.]|nr:restriction endonuclease subunit S [Ruminococcus sp.]